MIDPDPDMVAYVCRHIGCYGRQFTYSQRRLSEHYLLSHGEDLMLNDMRVDEWGVVKDGF